MKTENLSTLKIHKLSQEQYNREVQNGTIDENALYLTPDEEIDLTPYPTLEHVSNTYETKVEAIEKLTEAKTYTDIVASGKSDSNHNHDSDYDVIGSASESLILAKSYTDSKVANLTSTTVVDNKISSHNTSTSAHNDIRALIFDLTTKLNNFLDVDETTTDQLSEVLTLIENNKGTLESLTITKINVSDIINNLTTNSTSKVLSSAQGVAIKALIDVLQEELDSHTHTISDVSGLQSALDGKAASSHGTHVTYSTTAPVMDGTASVGYASTVARSDHKHPTDTSRASKTEFDTHVSDTTKHITSTERTNWNAAKTHADSAHAPSNAQPNQNAFSNIAVSGQTTVSADSVTDTLTLAGSNINITTDSANDKVTFSVADGTTSAKGVVQLTNSTSSTSTTTAATPNSVKSAYDLANEAKKYVDSKADTIQSASGEVIAVNNSAYTPLKGLKIFGKTEQKTTIGKNLFPLHTFDPVTSNGVTVTYDNGGIRLSGSLTDTTAGGYISTWKYDDDFVIPAGTYTCHFSALSQPQIVIRFLNVEGNTQLASVQNVTIHTHTVTLTEPAIMSWSVYRNKNYTQNIPAETIYIQIEEGSTATAYEPYTGGIPSPNPEYPQALESVGESLIVTMEGTNVQPQTLTITVSNGLSGIPVASGGNYTDANGQQWICDEVDFEKGVYVQRVRKVFVTQTASTSNSLIILPDTAGARKPLTIVSNYTDGAKFGLSDSGENIFIRGSANASANKVNLTYTELNALLTETPMVLIYALAKENPIPLSEIDQNAMEQYATLHTNYPNTTIFNDAGADMEVKYYTPNTAVQMVHSPSDEGKVLTIDEHGCVVLGEPTTSDAIHNYLPLTGGTLSGNTTINTAGARYRVTNGTNTAWFGMNSAGSTIGIYDETNKKYLIQHDGTNTQLNGNCTGNAGSATKVYTTATNSSTYKSYQIPFLSGSESGNSSILKNNGIKFDVRDGATSQNGVALLLLGDTGTAGTDGNKSGGLYMYNSNGKYAAMIPAENTGNITLTLPDSTGTLALNKPTTATLSASSWSSLSQTVSVTGVTANNTVIVTPAPASHNVYCECGVYCSAQASGKLTFKCAEKPASNITVNILIM